MAEEKKEKPKEKRDEEQEQPENNDWTGPHRTPGLGY